VSVNWVDLIVLVGLLIVAVAGWRAGVISTAAAFAGFIAGALVAAWLVPRLVADRGWPSLLTSLATLAAMLVFGLIGQAILGALGRGLRDAVDFKPLRLLDSASGTVVSVVAFLLSVWLVLSVAATMPAGRTADEVRGSTTLPLLERLMAGPAGDLVDDARALLGTLELPSLPFNPATLPPVQDPGDVELTDEVLEVADASVVQVATSSSRCSTSSIGSGLVVARERVATNAHVVAGATQITVRQQGRVRSRPATLVHLDRDTDLAVLYVPGLSAPVPEWVPDARRGTDAAVVGYPGGGRLTLRGARVRGEASLTEESGSGIREVVVFQGLVQPGNSGGPLLDLSGDVLGLVFANSSVDQRTGFALSADEVRPTVAETRRATEEVSTGSCPVRSGG
jgi:S1-C subfamily serine protease